jgi:hypothetical protein
MYKVVWIARYPNGMSSPSPASRQASYPVAIRVNSSVRKSLPTWAFTLERMTGIEPALSAWEADVLPLNYIRRLRRCLPENGHRCCPCLDMVPELVACVGDPHRGGATARLGRARTAEILAAGLADSRPQRWELPRSYLDFCRIDGRLMWLRSGSRAIRIHAVSPPL